MGPACLHPTNMPLPVEGDLQWVQRQNCTCFLPSMVKKKLADYVTTLLVVPVSVWELDASVAWLAVSLEDSYDWPYTSVLIDALCNLILPSTD